MLPTEIESCSPESKLKERWQVSVEEVIDSRFKNETNVKTTPVTQDGSRQEEEDTTPLGLELPEDGFLRSTSSLHKASVQGIRLESSTTANRSSSLDCNIDTVSESLTPDDAALCRHGPPCLLDEIILDFLPERLSLQLLSTPLNKIIGPAYPSVSKLLEPHPPQFSPLPHLLSQVVSNVLPSFKEFFSLPEKMAILYIIYLVVRWAVDPTPANYDRLRSWIFPRACQLFEPYPIWIDFLHFPQIRDHLARNFQRDDPFDILFIPFTKALSLNLV